MNSISNKLKLGIPKGSLEEATINLFARSGWKIRSHSRNYFPEINDPEIAVSLARARSGKVSGRKAKRAPWVGPAGLSMTSPASDRRSSSGWGARPATAKSVSSVSRSPSQAAVPGSGPTLR